jgi:hypothetical protein
MRTDLEKNNLRLAACSHTTTYIPSRMSGMLANRKRARHTEESLSPPIIITTGTQRHSDWIAMSALTNAAVAARKEVAPLSPKRPSATFAELGLAGRRRKRRERRDAPCAKALVESNNKLRLMADRQRVLAREQNECATRAISVLAIGVARSLKHVGPADGLIGIVASASPSDAGTIVSGNAEELLSQLETHGATLMRTANSLEGSATTPNGVVALVEAQMRVASASEAICALRNIRSTLVERDTKAATRDRRVEHILSLMARSFAEYFEPAAYGLVGYDSADVTDEIDEACPVCSNNYESCSTAVHRRVRFDCCNLKQAMCAECLMRAAYTESKHACQPTFSCSFCRSELPLYTTAPATAARESADETLQSG